MNTLISLHSALFRSLENGVAPWLMPTLARFLFAAILLLYYWNSGLTKLGEGIFGIFSPSDGAYIQIFPKGFEAVGYDGSQFGRFHTLGVLAGTGAEFILPLLIVAGLLTRLSALGMSGVVVVQTLTDLYGHGGIAHAETLGAWFDRIPDAIVFDQRSLWIFLLLVIVMRGPGPFSLDRILGIEAREEE